MFPDKGHVTKVAESPDIPAPTAWSTGSRPDQTRPNNESEKNSLPLTNIWLEDVV